MNNSEIAKHLAQLKTTDWIAILAEVTKDRDNLAIQVEVNKGKIELYQAAMDSEDLTEMSAASKILNFRDMGRNRLFKFLRDLGILRGNNEPYQQYVEAGYFKVVEQVFPNPSTGETMINRKTMVYQKGLDYIRQKLVEDGYERN